MHHRQFTQADVGIILNDNDSWTLWNRITSMDRFAKLSILMTLAKLPITAVAFLLIMRYEDFSLRLLQGMAVLLVSSAMLLDILDGVVFLQSQQATDRELRRLRRILDTVCDRILIYVTVCSLCTIGIPIVPLLIILGREFALIGVCALPYLTRGVVYHPNTSSRCAAALIGIQVIYYCFGNPFSTLLTCLFLAFSLMGLIQYVLAPSLEVDEE